MELVNLMYRYINRFITGDKLLQELKNVDLSKYTSEEKAEIQELIAKVEDILKNVPNEVDEIEKKRLESVDKYIDMFDQILSKDIDGEMKEKFGKKRDDMIKEKSIQKDGGKRFEELFELLTKNSLVGKYAESMDDKELLDFITQYISVPLPPNIDQEGFDVLVKVGIDSDERESLWRLAFNYNRKGKDFSLIVDYFILKRDAYYLTELISAVSEDLDMDELLEKVIRTDDRDFFKDIVDYNGLSYLTDEQKERLKEIK